MYVYLGLTALKKGHTDLTMILEEICITKNVSNVIDTEDSKVIVDNGIDSYSINFKKLYVFAKCECIQVDMDTFLDSRIEIRIAINKVKNETFQIAISDPDMDYFLPNDFTFSGDYIEINPAERLLYTYSLKLTEIEDTVEDGDCQEYIFGQSFQECIRNYAEKVFNEKIGCVPPWFTGEKEKMCSHSFTRLAYENISNLVRDIAYEEHFADCLRPCKRMEIESRLRLKSSGSKNGSTKGIVILRFYPQVVKIENIPIMKILDLVSNIGGIFGLCLGLSLLDIYDFMVGLAKYAKSLKVWQK